MSVPAKAVPIEPGETAPSALSQAVEEAIGDEDAQFDNFFEEAMAAKQPDASATAPTEPAEPAAPAEPVKPAATAAPAKPSAPAPEPAPAEPVAAAPAKPVAPAPTREQAREQQRLQILQGRNYLDQMQQNFERTFNSPLIPPEVTEARRAALEAEAELAEGTPRVAAAVDAKVARMVKAQVDEAVATLTANMQQMTTEQAWNAQRSIVRQFAGVDINDEKFHKGFNAWVETLPVKDARGIMDVYNGGDAGQVIDVINQYNAATGQAPAAPAPATKAPASSAPAASAAAPRPAATTGRNAAAMAVPARRTAAPATTGVAGKDPEDFDAAFAERAAKYGR
jgi:hypothetical protein